MQIIMHPLLSLSIVVALFETSIAQALFFSLFLQLSVTRKRTGTNGITLRLYLGHSEIIRPCPAGTIFFEEKCVCDFELSRHLPTTPGVSCQPSAFFPFDQNLQDQSQNSINVGLTNMSLTHLGTAYLNGHSEMNIWSFAGTDWGNKLVIKLKFRFDNSNTLIEYGGLPVDLRKDFGVNMSLKSEYNMTVMDWRLWNHLRTVRSLEDWRQLLSEFGQFRTFYIFLGTLGFKPGTFSSIQVVRILRKPEVYRAFQVVLSRIRQGTFNDVTLNEESSAGLEDILHLLRPIRGMMNWDSITAQLREKIQTSGSSRSSGSVFGDSADNITDDLGGFPKQSAMRARNIQDYQALVTNCQGQDGQEPSIMVVANEGEVRFALKTNNNDTAAVVSVPAVEGWNDFTLIYDWQALTGVVENWKGIHKSSVNLQGDVERRQTGLLVGSCQGFASFHGEIDDLSVYKCLTPAVEELRDRVVV